MKCRERLPDRREGHEVRLARSDGNEAKRNGKRWFGAATIFYNYFTAR